MCIQMYYILYAKKEGALLFIKFWFNSENLICLHYSGKEGLSKCLFTFDKICQAQRFILLTFLFLYELNE